MSSRSSVRKKSAWLSSVRLGLSSARLESLEWTPGGDLSADGQFELSDDDSFVNDEYYSHNEELHTAQFDTDTDANETHINSPARNVCSLGVGRIDVESGDIFVDESERKDNDDCPATDDVAAIFKGSVTRPILAMVKIKKKLAEIKNKSSRRKISISMGKHLTTTNVFTMEQMSNRTVRMIMLIYYISFVVLFATAFTAYKRTTTVRQFTILQTVDLDEDGATGDELLCSPEPEYNINNDGTLWCVPNSTVTVDQAKLLANTVVVSDGLNLTNWVGETALPGTPPFQAHSISGGAFLVNSSILLEECNPELNYPSSELNYTWSDIRGAFWVGNNGDLMEDKLGKQFKSVIIDLVFKRPDGTPWPSNMTYEPFPLALNAYACVRGGPNDCLSVGHFRDQFMHNDDNPYGYILKPTIQVNGPEYVASLYIPNAMLLEDVVESIGWRMVAFGDPGGAVTDCAKGINCIVHAHVSGEHVLNLATVATEWAILVIYAIYFSWWIYTVTSRLGTNPTTWHIEDKWVLILGAGFLMYNGFYYNSLQIVLQTKDFAFKERMWVACLVLKQLGQVLMYFALACFCDAPRRFVVSKFDFYKWKAFFFLSFYTSMFVVTMYNFPAASGRDQPGTELRIGGLGFVTSSSTWPHNDKIVLVTFEIVWILCIVFGFAYYLWRSYKTTKALANLPYNMTRPAQLSFKFFCWATRLWVILEFVSLCVSFAVVTKWSRQFHHLGFGFLNYSVLSLNQMHLFANNHSPAKLIFSFMFTIVYELFFLPLPPLSKDAIPKSHHITEDDAKVKTNEEHLTGRFLLVLDRARLLCCCSREVYLPFDDEERKQFTGITQEELEGIRLSSKHTAETISEKSVSCDQSVLERREDPEMVTTPASKPQLLDSFLPSTSFLMREKLDPVILARFAGEAICTGRKSPPGSSWAMGCRVIKHITEPEYADMHNTRAILYRHESSNDLIIAFRGTATGLQIKTDCMTQKVRVSLDTFLTIPRSTRNLDEDSLRLPEKLEEMLCEGTCGKVKLFDLLHKETEVGDLPEFLRNRTNAQDGIHGSTFLHFGFWSSYSRLRKQVHSAIYEELVSNPGRLLVCGHSLGGAQATACAYDMSRWIIPSVRKYLLLNQGRGAAEKISLSCYTYGSPRLGGPKFRAAFNKAVPDMQRIICDGDVVTIAIPKWLGFCHVGDENVFDYTGSCGRNPSFMEKHFAHKSRTHANAHRMTSYTHAIKMAYHPSTSIQRLLELLKDAYGLNTPILKDSLTSADCDVK